MSDSPSFYPKNHGKDLTDWFMEGHSVKDLTDLLSRAVTVEPPKEPEIDPGVARFFGGRNGNKFMPALLSQAIMEDLDIVSDPLTGLVYRWEGRFWEPYDLQYIRAKALQMLGDEGSSSRASDVASMVRDLSVLPMGRKMNDHEELICLQNGMFHLKEGEIAAHAKEFYATHALGVEFDPKEIPDCPRWKKFLEDAVQDPEAIREIQKYFGYCLTRDTRYEKMLILYGPGGDGKSTLMNVLRDLVGAENCSHIPMGRLEDQFYLSRLVDKLVNMSTEVESRAMQSQEIKAIVSGDPVSASFKNQTPFDFNPVCKLVYSTNRLPKMLDNSDGFFRRVMIIEMKGQFVKRGDADIHLKDKLKEEMSGIFAWAWQGLIDLWEEGFSQVASMEESLHDYKRINNNILYFIENHVQPAPGGKEFKFVVYEEYVRRCRSWNLMPQGEPFFRKEFARLLRDLDIPFKDGKKTVAEGEGDDLKRAYNLTRKPADGSRLNAYAGFCLVEEKHSEAESASPDPLPAGARHE